MLQLWCVQEVTRKSSVSRRRDVIELGPPRTLAERGADVSPSLPCPQPCGPGWPRRVPWASPRHRALSEVCSAGSPCSACLWEAVEKWAAVLLSDFLCASETSIKVELKE